MTGRKQFGYYEKAQTFNKDESIDNETELYRSGGCACGAPGLRERAYTHAHTDSYAHADTDSYSYAGTYTHTHSDTYAYTYTGT